MSGGRQVNPEMVESIARQTGIEADKVGAVVAALGAFVQTKLVQGEAVVIPGVGKVAIEELEGSENRNPATGAVIRIPAFKRPVLLAAKSLKDAINK